MRVSFAAATLLVACTAFDDLQWPPPGYDAGSEAGVDAGSETSAPVMDAGAACAGEHIRSDGARCYRFNPNRVAWQPAEDACQAWGGHLVSVHSDIELKFVRDLVTAEEPESSTGIWIGLNSLGHPNVWTWTDLTDATYTHWAEHEPDTSATPKECVYQYDEQYDGHWDNFQCSVEAESVCVKPL